MLEWVDDDDVVLDLKVVAVDVDVVESHRPIFINTNTLSTKLK